MSSPPKHQSAPRKPNGPQPRLRLGAGINLSRRIIAHHFILTGYAHWLPNDIRGSGSTQIKSDKLAQLGPIHHGRKAVQPSREDLKAFHRAAAPLLQYKPIWFDEAKRQALSEAFARVIAGFYTVWACAICSNHAHFCIRVHRDNAQTMWERLTEAGRKVIRAFPDVEDDHPVWTTARYNVFLFTPADVRGRIQYINRNPSKEGLPVQAWAFVQAYDGWPMGETAR